MAGRLDGKVAVVTGASSGIGVETARTTVERIELARLLSIVERAGRLAGTPTP
jgi:NAD(P)-dependent dehydrogenase (short-subunit alcohol dehydrogenase family)